MRRVVLSVAEYYIGVHFLFPQNRWASPEPTPLYNLADEGDS